MPFYKHNRRRWLAYLQSVAKEKKNKGFVSGTFLTLVVIISAYNIVRFSLTLKILKKNV